MQDITKSNNMVEWHFQVLCVCVCPCTAMVNNCMCTFQVQAWGGFISSLRKCLKTSQKLIQHTF